MKKILILVVLFQSDFIFSTPKKILASYWVKCTPMSSQHRSAMNKFMLSCLQNAQKSIWTNMYAFNSIEFAHAIAFARAVNKAKIQVILDRSSTNGTYNMQRYFQSLGIPVKVYASLEKLNHHKYSIIDGRKVLTGSFNYSDSAMTRNLENANLLEGRAVARYYEQDFKYTQTEIEKLEKQARSKKAKIARAWKKKIAIYEQNVEEWKKSRKK